jgi:hypothetical protein
VNPAVRTVSSDCTPQSMTMCDDNKIKLIADSIRGIPDFPKKGILFWDVTTLLLDPAAFQATIDCFVTRYASKKIDVVAGTSFVFYGLAILGTALLRASSTPTTATAWKVLRRLIYASS